MEVAAEVVVPRVVQDRGFFLLMLNISMTERRGYLDRPSTQKILYCLFEYLILGARECLSDGQTG